MELICKKEALNNDGSKIMEFTKGIIYFFTKNDEQIWEVKSDNGKVEKFFNTSVMFEKINK